MGYYIEQDLSASHFCIAPRDEEHALKALQALKREDPRNGYFLDWDALREAKTFDEALDACRFEVHRDSNGIVRDIEFTGEKIGGKEFEIFCALASVGAVGEVVFDGEDCARWTYVLEDGVCTVER